MATISSGRRDQQIESIRTRKISGQRQSAYQKESIKGRSSKMHNTLLQEFNACVN